MSAEGGIALSAWLFVPKDRAEPLPASTMNSLGGVPHLALASLAS